MYQARDGFDHRSELKEGNTEILDNTACSWLQILYNLTYMPNTGDNTERVNWMSIDMKHIK